MTIRTGVVSLLILMLAAGCCTIRSHKQPLAFPDGTTQIRIRHTLPERKSELTQPISLLGIWSPWSEAENIGDSTRSKVKVRHRVNPDSTITTQVVCPEEEIEIVREAADICPPAPKVDKWGYRFQGMAILIAIAFVSLIILYLLKR